MERIELRADVQLHVDCWHCGAAVSGQRTARYLYPGDRPHSAIVEDWHACACGAYQNVRRPTEITVSPVSRT
ncbi:MAG: hypothetical protein JWO66_1394 [Candidatus Eremiobacteraeota bacterium]|jgi:sarcosine oxidase delta subunit|nr:hypothetical protein [Candidatus Eremiobacteraeota bacterium]